MRVRASAASQVLVVQELLLLLPAKRAQRLVWVALLSQTQAQGVAQGQAGVVLVLVLVLEQVLPSAAVAVALQVELALVLELELVSAQLVPMPPLVVQWSRRAAWVFAQVSGCDCPTR